MSALLRARLRAGESLGDRILKVDHAGEHGAVCIYSAQRWVARWRAPGLIDELGEFLSHECRHRELFADELARRGRRRCRSYWFCGIGGALLGLVTGLAGAEAMRVTTVSVERVVLHHLEEQMREIAASDPAAFKVLAAIIDEERDHHDRSLRRIDSLSPLSKIIGAMVSSATELVIWLGMKL